MNLPDTHQAITDYPYVCSESLDCDHTQIAISGITLTQGPTNWMTYGMNQQYFFTGYNEYTNWDFASYTPDLIVINLGTNDAITRCVKSLVSDATFTSTYQAFINNIRQYYPNTEIFLMRPFKGMFSSATKAVVDNFNAAGDGKVHYINTTDWVTFSDYYDGVHPTVDGQAKIANCLEPILRDYICE